MTRAQARAAYASSSLSSRQYQDLFCLTPSGVHVGYAWPALGHKKLTGRVVWITTANPHYSAAGLSPGTTLAKAKRTLTHAERFGSWYLLPGKAATTLVKVKGGVVREVGIASVQLTKSKLAEKRLVRGLS
jgi:hypothetical protein